MSTAHAELAPASNATATRSDLIVSNFWGHQQNPVLKN